MIAPLLALLLQVTPVAPIVKGTALPPPASDEAAVMAPIAQSQSATARRRDEQQQPDMQLRAERQQFADDR